MPQTQETPSFPNLDALPMHRRLRAEKFLPQNRYFTQRKMQREQNQLQQQLAAAEAAKVQSKSQPKPAQTAGRQSSPLQPSTAPAKPKIPNALKPPTLPGYGSVPRTSIGMMPKQSDWNLGRNLGNFYDNTVLRPFNSMTGQTTMGFGEQYGHYGDKFLNPMSDAWQEEANDGVESALKWTSRTGATIGTLAGLAAGGIVAAPMLAAAAPIAIGGAGRAAVSGAFSRLPSFGSAAVSGVASRLPSFGSWFGRAGSQAMPAVANTAGNAAGNAGRWVTAGNWANRAMWADTGYQAITGRSMFGDAFDTVTGSIFGSGNSGTGTTGAGTPTTNTSTSGSSSYNSDNWHDKPFSAALTPYTQNAKMRSAIPPLGSVTKTSSILNLEKEAKLKPLLDWFRGAKGTAAARSGSPRNILDRLSDFWEDTRNAWNAAGGKAGPNMGPSPKPSGSSSPTPPRTSSVPPVEDYGYGGHTRLGKDYLTNRNLQNIPTGGYNVGTATSVAGKDTLRNRTVRGQRPLSDYTPRDYNTPNAQPGWGRRMMDGAVAFGLPIAGYEALRAGGGAAMNYLFPGSADEYDEDSMIMLPNGKMVPRSDLRQPSPGWMPWNWGEQMSPYEQALTDYYKNIDNQNRFGFGSGSGGRDSSSGSGRAQMPSGLYSSSAWPDYNYYASQIDNRQPS